MIKSYEDENDRLGKFVHQTMNITPTGSDNKQSTSKIVEGVVTDFITNWHQIDRELS